MPLAGRGNASDTPFITVQSNGAIAGFVIYHIGQDPVGEVVPYPFAVSMVGNNAACTGIQQQQGGRGKGEGGGDSI